MATGTTPPASAVGEIWAQIIQDLGQPRPTSLGLGEVLNAFGKALTLYTPQSLSDVALAPANATAQAFPRNLITSTSEAIVSGDVEMQAITLPIDTVVNALNFITGGTAAVTPTHQWAALYDSNRNLLAISADGTTTAIGANAVLSFPIANVAAGAASSFTTTYSGLYYVGILVVAGTAPTFEGITGLTVANTVPPIVAGIGDFTLTTPSTFPHQGAAITPAAGQLYCYTT
jgi:hypothetical protein